MRLYRYTYDSANKKFVSTGSPQTISNFSSESLTIDKDSGGTVWATWTVVSGTTSKVYVNAGTNNGASWGTPFVLPTTGGVNPNVAVDDISTLVAFGTNKVDLLFSNQSDDTVYWSIHSDGAAASTWTGGIAVRGNKLPDDHLNIKSIQADSTGRVFVAVKTSFDHGTNRPTDPQINLLSWKPGSSWSSTTFGTIADCHTRPQVVLDDVNNKVYVFATGKTGTGTCTGNGDGAIYMKTTSLSTPTGAFTRVVGHDRHPGRRVGSPQQRHDDEAERVERLGDRHPRQQQHHQAVLVERHRRRQRYAHRDRSGVVVHGDADEWDGAADRQLHELVDGQPDSDVLVELR